MALNLVQQRGEGSVWDRLELERDTERWIAGALAGMFFMAGAQRRSALGLLFAVAGGSLAWWAWCCPDKRTLLRDRVRAALPTSTRTVDPVVEASEESFPASDAPAFTASTVR